MNREINANRCSVDFLLIGDEHDLIVSRERGKKIGAVIGNARPFRWQRRDKGKPQPWIATDRGDRVTLLAPSSRESGLQPRMDELLAFGEKTVRGRHGMAAKNDFECSALKAFQQRDSLQWPARDAREARSGQNESGSLEERATRRPA